MKPITLLVALLSVLALTACSSGGPPGTTFLDSINSAPPDTTPGCYDHKNRREPTVKTPFECAALTWVWKS